MTKRHVRHTSMKTLNEDAFGKFPEWISKSS